MADLAAARSTLSRVSPFDMFDDFVVLTGATIYQGSGVAIGSDGNLVHASAAGALYTLGIAEKTILAAPAGTSLRVSQGMKKLNNAAGHLLTIANRLGPCYWSDDQSVGTDSSKLLAGIVYDVEADGVWVIMGVVQPANAAGGALLAANNLSDVGAAATAATNLGLGTTSVPTFAGSMETNVATKTTTYGVTQAVDAKGMLISLTDGQIFNLPTVAAGNKGMEVTFLNSAADGAALMKVEPAAAQFIQGQIGAIEFAGVAAKGIWNTKATQKKGDRVTLRSDGTATWWVVGGIGVWASEA